MKKKNLFLSLATLIPTTYIALHSTPKLSIVTKLILNGDINLALNTDIIENEKYTILNDNTSEKIYSLTSNSNELSNCNFKVKKIGFLYFSNKFLS